jgi:hypothetical protein
VRRSGFYENLFPQWVLQLAVIVDLFSLWLIHMAGEGLFTLVHSDGIPSFDDSQLGIFVAEVACSATTSKDRKMGKMPSEVCNLILLHASILLHFRFHRCTIRGRQNISKQSRLHACLYCYHLSTQYLLRILSSRNPLSHGHLASGCLIFTCLKSHPRIQHPLSPPPGQSFPYKFYF